MCVGGGGGGVLFCAVNITLAGAPPLTFLLGEWPRLEATPNNYYNYQLQLPVSLPPPFCSWCGIVGVVWFTHGTGEAHDGSRDYGEQDENEPYGK